MTTEDVSTSVDSDTTTEVAAVADGTPEPAQDTDPPEDDSRGNREAAKYRRQLREAEAERDALAERVATLQRGEAERIAGTRISRPEALWAAGVELSDLLGDDGHVDPALVNAATVTAAEALGLTRANRGPVIPGQGRTPGKDAAHQDPWAAAFAPPQDR